MKKTMISIMLCLSASFIYPSCEKAAADYMESFYRESMGLNNVSIDSVRSFSIKVKDYVTVNPKEKENPLYQRIQSNIKAAALRISIDIDTIWDEPIEYFFKTKNSGANLTIHTTCMTYCRKSFSTIHALNLATQRNWR